MGAPTVSSKDNEDSVSIPVSPKRSAVLLLRRREFLAYTYLGEVIDLSRPTDHDDLR